MGKVSIKSVVESALCCGCGACVGICPIAAISMRLNPAGFLVAKIDENRCIQCGKCLYFCSGNNKIEVKSVDFIGKTINGYIGYATDSKLRSYGQSGGVVSALINYLIDKNIIDGAVVATWSKTKQRAIATYINRKEQILQCAGSWYSQTSPIEEMQKHQDKRIAVVTLGCQTQTILGGGKRGTDKKTSGYNWFNM